MQLLLTGAPTCDAGGHCSGQPECRSLLVYTGHTGCSQKGCSEFPLQCFSAVVGPNGSGKSNVIDAMLFVFGRRAKQVSAALQRQVQEQSAAMQGAMPVQPLSVATLDCSKKAADEVGAATTRA